ncbi:ASCH domain-containing protein [Pseudoalteromonas ulvae]|uniref:ASCH domain-containing protein n=1 Tax=Pseudoalteromonas ulvae TaxID=107327 RepID=UPI00186BB2C6|nr:ASCH domain-containing protein [Pseudoalteromonas ulvae]
MMHPSVTTICHKYFKQCHLPYVALSSWHFCDNEVDANACAKLVLDDIKRATSPSLWWFEAHHQPLPQRGDLNVVTNWQGEALCIIETTHVAITPFNEITEQYAALEGEGDKSLAYWRKVHWDYYHRELAGTAFTPTDTMPIVCETFKVVFKANTQHAR